MAGIYPFIIIIVVHGRETQIVCACSITRKRMIFIYMIVYHLATALKSNVNQVTVQSSNYKHDLVRRAEKLRSVDLLQKDLHRRVVFNQIRRIAPCSV